MRVFCSDCESWELSASGHLAGICGGKMIEEQKEAAQAGAKTPAIPGKAGVQKG